MGIVTPWVKSHLGYLHPLSVCLIKILAPPLEVQLPVNAPERQYGWLKYLNPCDPSSRLTQNF